MDFINPSQHHQEKGEVGPPIFKNTKKVGPIEKSKNKCFHCFRQATGHAFINNQLMNVCFPCHTVWPKEGDSFDIGSRPLFLESR